MTRRPGDKRALAVLLLACLLGAGLVALHRGYPDLMVRRLSAGGESSAPAQTPANPATGGRPAATPPPPESRFTVIALRPLFSPGRRPPDQPATPGPVSGSKELPKVILTGIVRAGADSLAIVEPARRGAQSEPALTLRVGDSLGSWTVEAIGVDRIVLIQSDERRELELKEDETRRRQAQPRNDRRNIRPQQNPQPPRTVQPTQPNHTQ